MMGISVAEQNTTYQGMSYHPDNAAYQQAIPAWRTPHTPWTMNIPGVTQMKYCPLPVASGNTKVPMPVQTKDPA